MANALILCAALLCVQPVEATIEQAASVYGVDAGLMMCIAERESSLDPLAVGDEGLAVGLYQFHLRTWRWMRGMAGMSQRDRRYDAREAAMMTAWALAHGYGHHWTAWGFCR